MKSFIGVNSTGSRYKRTLARVLLLIAMPVWAVTPVEEAKLLADDGAPNDFFGFNVALSGDTAVIGATEVDYDIRGIDVGDRLRVAEVPIMQLNFRFWAVSCHWISI